MNFKTFNNKSVKDGKVIMTEPTLLFGENQTIIDTHVVQADEICRIDLISIVHYGIGDYADYILKFNGISNPFSITVGDVLLIPNTADILKTWKPVTNSAQETVNPIRDQFINTKRLTPKDAKRIEYLQRKAAQKKNGAKEILPPNILKSGEKNIDISNGTINI